MKKQSLIMKNKLSKLKSQLKEELLIINKLNTKLNTFHKFSMTEFKNKSQLKDKSLELNMFQFKELNTFLKLELNTFHKLFMTKSLNKYQLKEL